MKHSTPRLRLLHMKNFVPILAILLTRLVFPAEALAQPQSIPPYPQPARPEFMCPMLWISFQSADAAVSEDEMAKIKSAVPGMIDHCLGIVVHARADSREPVPSTAALAAARGRAVASILVAGGLPANRVTIVSDVRESRPGSKTEDPEARSVIVDSPGVGP